MTDLISWDDYYAGMDRDSERWASSDRGWFFVRDVCRGHYLDYGPSHYRSPHEYCAPGACDCRLSQPGNVHAVRFRRDARNQPHAYQSRYFPTVAEAKVWIAAYLEG